MQRCTDTANYHSAAPLGSTGYFASSQQLVVSTGGASLNVYSELNGNLMKGSTPTVGVSSSVVDVAGGNFTSSSPQQVAYLTSNTNNVSIAVPGGSPLSLPLEFKGKYIAAGDIDGDGVDEVLVSDGGTNYATCSALTKSCTAQKLSASSGIIDVAMGDVDGDGYAELLFLMGQGLIVVNPNFATTGEPKAYTVDMGHALTYISAGDLDGDGIAEIIGKEPGGSTLFVDHPDHLYVYDLNLKNILNPQSNQLAELDVAHNSLDVTFGMIGNSPFMIVLNDSSHAQGYNYSTGHINSVFQGTVSGGGANRIAVSDVAGTSPRFSLNSGPTLVPGKAVPIAVMTLPPYSTTHSAGPSLATIGSANTSGTITTDGTTLTTTASLEVGIGVKIPVGPPGAGSINAEASVTGTLQRKVSQSKTVRAEMSVGQSFTMTANPLVNGFDEAGVELASSCSHEYVYDVVDPTNQLGMVPGDQIKIFVPVGGTTALWSTRRYNALAQALPPGTLPILKIGTKLGDLSSYPTTPQTLDGQPISTSDLVFPTTPKVSTSDVAAATFNLSTTESDVNTTAISSAWGVSVKASEGFTAGIVSVKVTETAGIMSSVDTSIGIAAGSANTFTGTVRAVPDDPNTPENESVLFGYSFQPFVFLQHYKTLDGDDRSFYVMDYAVTSMGTGH